MTRGNVMMTNLRAKYFSIFLCLLALWPTGAVVSPSQALEKNGSLVVIVTWGDVENTPARHVVVEVHGYGPGLSSEKSVLLKASQEGRYEASLQPGLYDVFVSEATSIPRCRRVEIRAGESKYWTLKLEIDDVYLDKSRAAP
jgi:hypothetical protein